MINYGTCRMAKSAHLPIAGYPLKGFRSFTQSCLKSGTKNLAEWPNSTKKANFGVEVNFLLCHVPFSNLKCFPSLRRLITRHLAFLALKCLHSKHTDAGACLGVASGSACPARAAHSWISNPAYHVSRSQAFSFKVLDSDMPRPDVTQTYL